MDSIYKQITPRSEELKQLIKLYYVHQSSDKNAFEKITYYPNFVNTINVYENTKVSWDLFSRTHEYELNNKYLKLLVGKFDKSREIILKGMFNKLTIVFNPLGLNHFVDIPLSKLVEDHFSFFDYFGKCFDDTLKQVFLEDDMATKRDLLDDYFLGELIGFKEQRLSFAVDKILNSSGNILIRKIAEELEVSRKTLLRLFKSQLSLSPTDFKSIVRFRKALNIYQNKTAKTNLSSLAYESFFYDQSDLNFHFKTKTGLSPRQLFSVIETIERGLYWKVDYVPKVQDIKDSTE